MVTIWDPGRGSVLQSSCHRTCRPAAVARVPQGRGMMVPRCAAAAEQRAGLAEQRAGLAEQRAGLAEQRASLAEQRLAESQRLVFAAQAEVRAAEQRASLAEQRLLESERLTTAVRAAVQTAEQRATDLQRRVQQLETELRESQQRAAAELEERMLCIACYDRPRSVVFQCGHMALCAVCTDRLPLLTVSRTKKRECPICRSKCAVSKEVHGAVVS